MSEMIINKAYITSKGEYTRLNTEIIEAGKSNILWVEVEKQYAKYLCDELADGAVYLCLPIALRNGYNIRSNIPVSEVFLHNINEILIPHLVRGDATLKKIKVIAPQSTLTFNGQAVGTGATGGVDSLYTLKEYENSEYPYLKLTHLVITAGSVDLWEWKDVNPDETNIGMWERRHAEQFRRYNAISAASGLPLVKIYDNYYNFVCWKDGVNRIRHFSVHNYMTMANIFALKKLWRCYLYSSSFPYNEFTLANNARNDCAFYELLSMHILTMPGFLCFSGGIKASRVEKTLALSDYPLAMECLHPCLSQKQNCTKPECGKCLRALLTLDYYDKLDNFNKVFDIELYKKDRIPYFIRLVKDKDSYYFKELYELIKKKYPEQMKIAQEMYLKSIEPVNRGLYNLLDYSYDFSLKFLELDNLEELIGRLISDKKYTEFCYVGDSRLGKTLINIISRKVKTMHIDDVKLTEITPILVLDTDKSIVVKTLDVMKNKGLKKVYTLNSFYRNLVALNKK